MSANRIPDNVYTKLQKAKVIFWDFDGVIKDSLSIKAQAFVKLFEGKTSPQVLKKIEIHHLENGGVTRKKKIPLYLKWAELSCEQRDIEDYLERFSGIVKKGVIDCPFFLDTLSYLESHYQDQIFILSTATPQSEIIEILEELKKRHLFKGIYGFPTLKHEAVELTLKEISIDPEACIFVGDSLKDYSAAQKTSVPFILKVHETNKNLSISLDCPSY